MNYREFQNLIGREQHSSLVVVYTTTKSHLVENIDMDANMADTIVRGFDVAQET